MKKFLITLSLIEYPVPDLLREIAGSEKNDFSVIDEMEQIGSFIQFDTYLNAYRIHHLFLDYLREKQPAIPEAEKRRVWARAADWCLRNNHKVDAILYYEKAGDYTNLLKAIYTLTLIVSRQTAAMLLKIMEDAPEELYNTAPTAWIVRSRLLLNLGRFDQVKEELITVVSTLEAQLSSGSRQLNPDTARTLSGCYDNLGFGAYLTNVYTGDYSFVHFFERGHYYSQFTGYTIPPPNSIINLGSYSCRIASAEPDEMDRYNTALSEMAPHMAAAMNGCGCGMDDVAWGELAFFRGDMPNAEACFNRALVKARGRDQHEIENRALFYLLRLNVFRGNAAAAADILEQLKNQLGQYWYINRFVYHDIVTGWFYVQTGRPEKIAAWLKNDFEESDLNSLVHGLEILVRAKYHFVRKRYPAALADLGSHHEEYEAFSSILGRLETKVLEAVCRYRLDDLSGAFRDLEAAWELAGGNGLYLPFAELGKDMRALAGAALKDTGVKIPKTELEKFRRSAALYAKNVFAISESCRADASKAKRKSPSGAALSPREMDVLIGLSQGLTREEIARVSSISINTVKSAARSVFNKLGAVNRADAVRIATEMEIL